jgi:hypothetical protein
MLRRREGVTPLSRDTNHSSFTVFLIAAAAGGQAAAQLSFRRKQRSAYPTLLGEGASPDLAIAERQYSAAELLSTKRDRESPRERYIQNPRLRNAIGLLGRVGSGHE